MGSPLGSPSRSAASIPIKDIWRGADSDQRAHPVRIGVPFDLESAFEAQPIYDRQKSLENHLFLRLMMIDRISTLSDRSPPSISGVPPFPPNAFVPGLNQSGFTPLNGLTLNMWFPVYCSFKPLTLPASNERHSEEMEREREIVAQGSIRGRM
ncbi:hypothetical protein CDAR_31551 [Caerostris darwini]|uniref:Uncharacterized protein n=1 Tax=Caerostris darwini TaxID=1538125 RepID=A0AAV4NR68_9ARAC|nr:hypothetical protein CDAR_31551 [Caerostris darwini]